MKWSSFGCLRHDLDVLTHDLWSAVAKTKPRLRSWQRFSRSSSIQQEVVYEISTQHESLGQGTGITEEVDDFGVS